MIVSTSHPASHPIVVLFTGDWTRCLKVSVLVNLIDIESCCSSAFNADVIANIAVTTVAGWTDIIGYRVTGPDGLFNLGGDFNPVTGRYTAPVDGGWVGLLGLRLRRLIIVLLAACPWC